MRFEYRKLFCRVLIAVLFVQWSGLPTIASARAAAQLARVEPARASLAVPSASDLGTARGAELQRPAPFELDQDRLAEQARTAEAAISRVHYDLGLLADSLGLGLAPAFFYVRDHIGYEAYPGILRGSKGAYLARAGNAFDRSLLLTELLRHGGVETRFASCRLPKDRAEALYERIFEPPAPAWEAPNSSPTAQASAFQNRLRNRARRDYAAIMDALGADLPFTAGPSRAEVVEEIRDHVWAQARLDDHWVDLDTAFAEAAPADTFCDGRPVQVLDALPAGAHQSVTLRIVAETLSGGVLRSETVLDVSRPAVDWIDREVFVLHAAGTGQGGLAGGIGSAILGEDAWTPVLWVDGETHLGKAVSLADQAPAKSGAPPVGGLGNLFGQSGLLPGPERHFVAEWLEFEIAFPGGRTEVTRRALADRAGLAWRAAELREPGALRPLARDRDGLLFPRDIHNVWFTAGPHDLASYATTLRALTDRAQDGAPVGNLAQQLWPVAMTGFALVVQSDHVVVPGLNDLPSLRLYADSPRILMFSVAAGPEGGAVLQYDLRRDRLRGVAKSESAERDLIARKIWFGALEGALEHEAAAYNVVSLGDPASAVASTSALLSAEGAIALGANAAPGLLFADDPETAARMASALSGGATLVVPKAAPAGGPSGWWEIARDGADTRAVFDGGLHFSSGSVSAAAVESAVQASKTTETAAKAPGGGPTSEYYKMILLGAALTVAIAARLVLSMQQVVLALGDVVYEFFWRTAAPGPRTPTQTDPGDCTKARQEQLQRDKNILCRGLGKRKCHWQMSCLELNLRIIKNKLCVQARTTIMELCYGGGNPTHVRERQRDQDVLDNCEDILRHKMENDLC